VTFDRYAESVKQLFEGSKQRNVIVVDPYPTQQRPLCMHPYSGRQVTEIRPLTTSERYDNQNGQHSKEQHPRCLQNHVFILQLDPGGAVVLLARSVLLHWQRL
jgi:hypothetical protein